MSTEFVTGDPVAEGILAELQKLPDGAIWEAMPMEGELPSGFFGDVSWVAMLLLHIQLETELATLRFLKVGRDFPVSVRSMLQHVVRCTLPELTLTRFVHQYSELELAGRLPEASGAYAAIGNALKGTDLPAAIVGLARLPSGELHWVFMCLKGVVAYAHLWKISLHMSGWLLENDPQIDDIAAV